MMGKDGLEGRNPLKEEEEEECYAVERAKIVRERVNVNRVPRQPKSENACGRVVRFT